MFWTILFAIVLCFGICACGAETDPEHPCYDNTGFVKLEDRVTLVESDEEMESQAALYGDELVSYEDCMYSMEVEKFDSFFQNVLRQLLDSDKLYQHRHIIRQRQHLEHSIFRTI